MPKISEFLWLMLIKRLLVTKLLIQQLYNFLMRSPVRHAGPHSSMAAAGPAVRHCLSRQIPIYSIRALLINEASQPASHPTPLLDRTVLILSLSFTHSSFASACTPNRPASQPGLVTTHNLSMSLLSVFFFFLNIFSLFSHSQ